MRTLTRNDLKITDSTIGTLGGSKFLFIKALNLQPIHLMGHSYGGYISLFSAWKHPDCFAASFWLLRCASILVKMKKSISVLAFLFTNFSAAMSVRRFQNGKLELALKAYDGGDLKNAVRYFYEGIREIPDSFEKLPDPVRSMMLDKWDYVLGELETEFPNLYERRCAID